MIVAGTLAIWLPFAASIAVNILVGWLLLFGGVGHLVFAWYSRGLGSTFLKLAVGILYLVVGFYMLTHPLQALVSLTLALAIYLVFEGILETILAFQLRPLPGSWWFLVDGVITLILGFLIWRTWPWNSEWAIGMLVGISILVSGFTRLMFSLVSR